MLLLREFWRRIRGLAAGAALLAAATQALAADAPKYSYPLMWEIMGETGTVYLFGSIHVLRPGIAWLNPQIQEAALGADVFVFEAPINTEGFAEASAYIAEHGTLPEGKNLREMLPDATRARFEAILSEAGIPTTQFDRVRPWVAMTILPTLEAAKQRAVLSSGVDLFLLNLAGATAKETRYLETMGQQLALISGGSDEEQLAALVTMIDSFGQDAAPMLINAMVEAWSTGDVLALTQITATTIGADRKARKLLLDDRNAAWVPQIQAMLKEGRTFFVVVGAAHLVGPKSVPAQLRARGIRVKGP